MRTTLAIDDGVLGAARPWRRSKAALLAQLSPTWCEKHFSRPMGWPREMVCRYYH